MSKSKLTWGWISFASFIIVMVLVVTDYINWFDRPMYSLIKNIPILEYFAILGSELFIGSVSILLILWLALKEKNFTGIIFTVLAIGGGNYINKFLKTMVERERPEALHGEDGFSFPSGHAMVGLIFMLVLAFIVSKYFTSAKQKLTVYAAAIVLGILTGLSRIPDAAHYPSDVLAGFLIGFSYYVLCELVYLKLITRK
ncbi:phosphatase PAP2 family protein [Bacillus salacetis]|uniref:phosphatase PAP2 family protein n=1 Tax=Bacillus salacetis TaxID=2315464 RepID=UPI003B9DF722